MHGTSIPSSQHCSSVVIGVDVGGTKIAAALVDRNGTILKQIRCPTVITSPKDTLDSISSLVTQLIEDNRVDKDCIQGVGFGIPGLVDHHNGIGIASVNLNWRNVRVKEGLEERLQLPCFIENDVKAAALGEMRFGTGKGMGNLALLIIGTGVAAAYIVDGKIIRGSHAMAGEIGHFKIDRSGPLCKCGARGCLEALISGPAIVTRALQKNSIENYSHPAEKSGERNDELTAEDIFSAAEQGNNDAIETLEEVSEYLAIAIQFISLSYDPQVVVLAGGIPQAGKVFIHSLNHALEKLAKESWVFGNIYTPDYVQLSTLGENAGVLGAAALVDDNLR